MVKLISILSTLKEREKYMKFSQLPIVVTKLEDIQNKFNTLIDSFENAKTAKEAISIYQEISRQSDDISTDFTVISIRFSQDTRNKEASEANDYLDEIGPYISQLFDRFNRLILASKFRPELEAKFGKYLFEMLETSIRCFHPSIMGELEQESKLVSEYNKLISGAKIKFRDEVLNLSQLGKYTTDKERATRKEAVTASTKFFKKNDQKLGEIYSKLVSVRNEMAIKLGFKNYVELGYLRLGRLDYNATDVAAYRDQIYREVVPLVSKLYRQSAKRAGIKSPKFYDLNQSFIDGNPTPVGDRDVLVSKATKMYDEMSPETSKFFRFMVDSELLDLEARPGKQGGGYMTYLPRYKAPFILANFNGTQGDVDTLTHEVGHAYQGYESKDIEVSEYRSPTLEACEIHSMSMEFFAHPWMGEFFENADKYRLVHLEGAIKFLPYGVSVDEFQQWVYENPTATHEQRCAQFRLIEKKYLPFKKYSGFSFLEKGTFWLRQGHIFSTAFYYIDYTLAQVVAFQFANEMNKDYKKAWNKYVKLCRMGGKYPFVNLLEHAKLRNPFIEGNVKKAIQPLKKQLKELSAKVGQ